jgi:DNA-binding protein H-NS
MAREASKKAKEELLRKMEESAVYQKQAEKKRLDDISRYEKHSAIRESWAKARIAADSEQLRREMEETRKQQSRTSGLKPASTTVQSQMSQSQSQKWRG